MLYTSNPERGQILLVSLVFLGIFLSITTSLLGLLVTYAKSERTTVARAEALALAEAGVDLAMYRLNADPSYTGEVATPMGNGTFTTSISPINSSAKLVTSSGTVVSNGVSATRTVVVTASIDSTLISFRYGIQAGNGGFTLSNSSRIYGNVYAGGPVVGNNDNDIFGDVVSAGAGGVIYGIHATGTAYAHTLGHATIDTTIDKDAYYTTKTNTVVGGTSHPNSADQTPVALPISDAQITDWENQAEAGGTISSCDASGNYTITTSISLGPKKIECNLVVKSTSGVLTVTGPIWVSGNITTQTGPTIRMDPALESSNVAIIADNPSNRSGSGIITIGQTTIFQGSGFEGSFVFLISQNNSAESGGSIIAIDMSQGSSAAVAYASHGLISLSQSVGLKEATAYKISLSQSASVSYDRGLPSTLFETGSGGSWAYLRGTYAITR
jgi:hypothetical protein